jgi:hypothetical protein
MAGSTCAGDPPPARGRARRAASAARIGVAFASLLLLAGCLSMPVSTLWKLRSFGIDEFLALDPADVRAAVRTDARANFAEVILNVTTEWQGGGRQHYQIRLRPDPRGDARLEPAPTGRRWLVFALDPAGAAAMRELQRSLAADRQRRGQIAIGIEPREATVPDEIARALPVRVDLLLDRRDGYFTMIRETAVDTSQRRNDNPPTTKAR